MKNILNVLYCIDNPEVTILEVEGTEVDEGISWLIYYKPTAQVKRFTFSAFSRLHTHNRQADSGILRKVKSFRKFWIEIDNRIIAFSYARPRQLPENMIEDIDRQYGKLVGL